MEFDPVEMPLHYTAGDIECLDAMVAAFGEERVQWWARMNAFKYLWRAEGKGGDEDLRKAAWYLRFAVGDDPRQDRRSPATADVDFLEPGGGDPR